MKKQSLFYLKYIKIILFLILLFISVVQCQNQNSDKPLLQRDNKPVASEHQDTSEFRMLLKDSFNIELFN